LLDTRMLGLSVLLFTNIYIPVRQPTVDHKQAKLAGDSRTYSPVLRLADLQGS